MRYIIGYGRSLRLSRANLISSRLYFHSESTDTTSRSDLYRTTPTPTVLASNEEFGVINSTGVECVYYTFHSNANERIHLVRWHSYDIRNKLFFRKEYLTFPLLFNKQIFNYQTGIHREQTEQSVPDLQS